MSLSAGILQKTALNALLKSRLTNIHCSSLTQWCSHLTRERFRVDQTGFHKSVLTTPNHLLVFQTISKWFPGFLAEHLLQDLMGCRSVDPPSSIDNTSDICHFQFSGTFLKHHGFSKTEWPCSDIPRVTQHSRMHPITFHGLTVCSSLVLLCQE